MRNLSLLPSLRAFVFLGEGKLDDVNIGGVIEVTNGDFDCSTTCVLVYGSSSYRGDLEFYSLFLLF